MVTGNPALLGRILIVDDDPILRSMLSIALTEAGHQVLQAENGALALDHLRLLKSTNNLPDAVITDIQMPQMGGMELLERMSSAEIRVPAIAMTAVGDKDLVVRLLRLGAEEFIDKPFDMGEMCQRIAAVMRRSKSRLGQSGLEIQFEGQLVRLDKDPNEARRILERMRDRVDTFEAEEKGRIQLPTETETLDLAWNSRQTREHSGKMVAYSSSPDHFALLAAHPAGHDALALQTSSMIRMIFTASFGPQGPSGEEFLRILGGLLYQQPKQPLVRALLLYFDFQTNKIEIACAGHPSPILVPHSSLPHSILPECGGELGPHPAPHISLATIPFQAADRLLIPCPGLPALSRIHAPTGAPLQLGLQGLTEFCQKSRGQPLPAMITSVWENAMEFANWNSPEDLLLIGLERKPKH